MNRLFHRAIGIALFFVCLISPLYGEASAPTLSLENEFIKIIVNQGPEDLGRFAVETTGGDPKNTQDNDQSLIYGRPIPWTSYTTVRIDGKNYVFGGMSKKTSLRSGQTFLFGTVVSQLINDSGIVTVCRFGDDIRVTQTLTFVRNPATKVLDTAMISYSVQNDGSREHEVGIRMMMDTKLGSNDGAPFRMGAHAIESERLFNKDELSEFWQTFDQLDSPSVIAQGTLLSPENNISGPDHVYLSNWGTLSDSPWDKDYEKDRSFVRAGELDKDTALALFWDPKTVAPRKGFTVGSLYGLGGLTLSPGALSLGLTAPAEVFASDKNTISLMAYVSNSGGYDSNNTKVNFILPSGFIPADGKSLITIGSLKAGETRQIPMKIRLNDPEVGVQSLRIEVSSSTLANNSLSRSIEVLAPPRLRSELRLPVARVVTLNRDVIAEVLVTNPTAHTVSDVSVTLAPEYPLSMADFEPQTKSLHLLRSRQTARLNWILKLKSSSKKLIPVRATVESSATRPDTLVQALQLMLPTAEFGVTVSTDNISEKGFFYLNLFFNQAPIMKGEAIEIGYDPRYVSFLRTTAGPRFVEFASTYRYKTISIPGSVELTGIESGEPEASLDICKLQFHAKKAGVASFQLLRDGIPFRTITVTIKNKEGVQK